jgi:hypothetical protein
VTQIGSVFLNCYSYTSLYILDICTPDPIMCGGIFSAIFFEIYELWDLVLLGLGSFMVKSGL